MSYDNTEHTIGHGKKLEYADTEDMTGAEQIFGTVNIGNPERELGESEFTNDNSPNRTKEYKPTLYEPGECTFTYKYAKTEFAKVETLFALAEDPETLPDATKFWRITWPDGSTSKFKGWIKSNDFEGEQEDGIEVEAVIKVTGKTTFIPFTPGS